VMGREGFSAGGQSPPSKHRFLLGRGGDTSVIYFGRGREGAKATLGFRVEEVVERKRARRRQAGRWWQWLMLLSREGEGWSVGPGPCGSQLG
jgi:hypothetical protein